MASKCYLFFDNASTTKCCEAAAQMLLRYSVDDYGNPSSSHALGLESAKAIREARQFFATTFGVISPQVIFTGSGTEADNLALYGVAIPTLAIIGPKPRIIVSAIEHAAVRKTALSMAQLGFDIQIAPVDPNGHVREDELLKLVTHNTVLVSIMQVNNIVGAIQNVERLASAVKAKAPGCMFHTDAIQAFGRVKVPGAPSSVDLVSISGHKVEGPKGVGALILLNSELLQGKLRPLIWGGEQEGGYRSGTQSAGLIAGFHVAAKKAVAQVDAYQAHCEKLRARLKQRLSAEKISALRFHSPESGCVPHIVNLGAPGFPGQILAQLLEQHRCLVSTGSACSSQKPEPDAVLQAMGLPSNQQSSAIRISFGMENTEADVDHLAKSIGESLRQMSTLLQIPLV